MSPLSYSEQPLVFGDLARAYTCSGTPADCVKIALRKILKHRPDICLSGVNHGTNASVGVLYSGTIAVALEAATKNISAIAFSLDDYSPDANFEPSFKFVRQLIVKVLEEGLSPQTILNVNFPKAGNVPYKQLMICRQTKGIWQEKFEDRVTPWGHHYHWLYGDFEKIDDDGDNDISVLEKHCVAVVPIRIDMTDYESMERLKKWKCL